jgi:TMEM175 potassium channel family protein
VSSVIRWARWLAIARAPEGEASADPRTVHRDTTRLVTFSDSVFAITITLLVLEIRPPTADGNLLHGLVALWPSYFAYAVTFLFIGQVWANHVMFDHIRAANRAVLLLNTLLLMVVAFLSFATSVLARSLRSGPGERTAVVLYGITFDLTALTFNAVWQYASRHRLLGEALGAYGRRSHRQTLPARPRLARNRRSARRPSTRPGPGRDRRVQRLLLAPDPRRESPPAMVLRPDSGQVAAANKVGTSRNE